VEKTSQHTQEQTIALHLASIMQKWAEICRRGVDLEISPELQYYMAGRSDAHEMDAARCRSATSVDVQHKPPEDLMRFSRAYEIILGMLGAATPLNSVEDLELLPDTTPEYTEEPEEPFTEPEIVVLQTTALGQLRIRAAELQNLAET